MCDSNSPDKNEFMDDDVLTYNPSFFAIDIIDSDGQLILSSQNSEECNRNRRSRSRSDNSKQSDTRCNGVNVLPTNIGARPGFPEDLNSHSSLTRQSPTRKRRRDSSLVVPIGVEESPLWQGKQYKRDPSYCNDEQSIQHCGRTADIANPISLSRSSFSMPSATAALHDTAVSNSAPSSQLIPPFRITGFRDKEECLHSVNLAETLVQGINLLEELIQLVSPTDQ